MTSRVATVGFILDSGINDNPHNYRWGDLKKAWTNLLLSSRPYTIRAVAPVIGKIFASFPGVEYGPLYHRILELAKSHALKLSKGDFCSPTFLPYWVTKELKWWINNIETAYKKLSHDTLKHQITTDASSYGWVQNIREIQQGGHGLH